MANHEFYVLNDRNTKGAFNAFINLSGLNTLSLFRSEVHPTKPIDYTRINGNKFFDLLNAGNGMYLLSDSVFKIFEENRISGWGYLPGNIHTGNGDVNSNYGLLTVKGRCGLIDYSKSEIIMKQPFTPTGTAIQIKRGLYFDIKSWDGSDIFTPKNTLFTLITEHVKNILERYKFTNISIEKVTDFEIY